jgi:uncharacterized phage-associated protein
MATSLDVARYLIHLASPAEDEDVDCLSHLRLQKLLYYVQGWHLAAFGRPLFAGQIEAWTHGPVVREVYPTFRAYGWQAIPPTEGADPSGLSQKEKAFIRSIWDVYKQYSATALRDMTHQEAPWLEARGSLAPNQRCENVISSDSLRAFFLPRLKEQIFQSDARLDREVWEKSEEAMKEGRVQTTQEIRRELHRRRSGASEE